MVLGKCFFQMGELKKSSLYFQQIFFIDHTDDEKMNKQKRNRQTDQNL